MLLRSQNVSKFTYATVGLILKALRAPKDYACNTGADFETWENFQILHIQWFGSLRDFRKLSNLMHIMMRFILNVPNASKPYIYNGLADFETSKSSQTLRI